MPLEFLFVTNAVIILKLWNY